MKNYYKVFKSLILYDKVGRFFRWVLRNRFEKRKLKNHGFTILAQNCIGSIWYHDLGERFNSPTINMKFDPDGFVRFIADLPHYLSVPIRFLKDRTESYPVGMLDDVLIEFVHYHSEQEVIDKWNERKKRINTKNMCVVACDGGMSVEARHKFISLSHIPNKILFTSTPPRQLNDCECITLIFQPFFNDNMGADARLLNFCSVTGERYYNRIIDYVVFINSLND